ncbi:MAG: hypothetical protein AAEJ52_01465, partial [Myxococcota bacterium]
MLVELRLRDNGFERFSVAGFIGQRSAVEVCRLLRFLQRTAGQSSATHESRGPSWSAKQFDRSIPRICGLFWVPFGFERTGGSL